MKWGLDQQFPFLDIELWTLSLIHVIDSVVDSLFTSTPNVMGIQKPQRLHFMFKLPSNFYNELVFGKKGIMTA